MGVQSPELFVFWSKVRLDKHDLVSYYVYML
jgi:hypothetical protein